MRPAPPKLPKDPPPELAVSPRLTRLAEAGAAAVPAFWAEVGERGTPLVEPADAGRRIVTFLWRGDERTRGVVLMANKLTDPSVWRESTLDRLAGTDVWHRSYRLPADWRASYRLAPIQTDAPAPDAAIAPPPPGAPASPTAKPAPGAAPGTGPGARWREFAALALPDPFNPRRLAASGPGAPLSIAELPDAPPQPWLAPRPGVAAGTVRETRVRSAALGNERSVWVYTPAAAARGLVVVLDGEDWVTRLRLPTTLDNLIAAGRIPPVAAALVSALDLDTRWRELTGHAPFLTFLEDELLPRLAVGAPRQATVIAGRSLGALTALYAGLRGSRFGALLCQSASLWHPLDGRDPVDLAASDMPADLHAYLEVGRDEWVLLDPHRRLRDALGCRLTYREYSGGHDPACWRGGIADGLVALLGGLSRADD